VRRVVAVTGPRTQRSHVARFQRSAADSADFELLEYPSFHRIAEALARPADCVLIFGGDGTLNRYLGVLLEAQSPVVPIPSGSGNDFARAIGILTERAALERFEDFLAGRTGTWMADIGALSTHDASGAKQRQFFSCCVNVGLDAEAAERANRLPNWLKARGGYFLGGLRAIIAGEPQQYELALDGAETRRVLWFIAILNTPTYGGGLVIAPHAGIADGALESVTCEPIPRWKLFHHIPKLLTGKHIREVPYLEYRQARSIAVNTRVPQPVYADGEFMGFTSIEVSLADRSLPVLRRKSF
jgi:diacylglycerol kinase (ATP)